MANIKLLHHYISWWWKSLIPILVGNFTALNHRNSISWQVKWRRLARKFWWLFDCSILTALKTSTHQVVRGCAFHPAIGWSVGLLARIHKIPSKYWRFFSSEVCLGSRVALWLTSFHEVELCAPVGAFAVVDGLHVARVVVWPCVQSDIVFLVRLQSFWVFQTTKEITNEPES